MPRIAILDDYQNVALDFAAWQTLPADCNIEVFNHHIADGAALVAALVAALEPFDIIVAMRERTAFPKAILDRLPCLKLLVTTGRSNSAIDVVAAKERNILVCGTDSLGPPTVELTWALILSLVRRLPAEEAALRAGGWQTGVGFDLEGKILGIIGLGRIGSRVATIGRAFGMNTVAWSPRLDEETARANGCGYLPLMDLMASADIVSIHAKLTPASRGVVGTKELAAMKRTAYLINAARGPLVDEHALIDSLVKGEVAGYGADVFDIEPLPASYRLLFAPNTVLTPHIGYVTAETYKIFYSQTLENIIAFLSGAPIRAISSQ